MLILFCMRGCGCIERPAFPAPSIFGEANEFLQTSGESRREIAESYVKSVILRCEPCGALAPLGEPRRMSGPGRRPSRRIAFAMLLRMTGIGYSKIESGKMAPDAIHRLRLLYSSLRGAKRRSNPPFVIPGWSEGPDLR